MTRERRLNKIKQAAVDAGDAGDAGELTRMQVGLQVLLPTDPRRKMMPILRTVVDPPNGSTYYADLGGGTLAVVAHDDDGPDQGCVVITFPNGGGCSLAVGDVWNAYQYVQTLRTAERGVSIGADMSIGFVTFDFAD